MGGSRSRERIERDANPAPGESAILAPGESETRREPEKTPREPASRFFRELYWLIVLALAGVAVGLLVIPPRAARHDQLRRFEQELRARNRALSREVAELEGALASFDQDPFYREAVYRRVIGVKRAEERFASELPRAPAPPEEERIAPPVEDGPADLPFDDGSASEGAQ